MLTTGHGYHASFTVSASGWLSSSSYSVQFLTHNITIATFMHSFVVMQLAISMYVGVSVTQCNVQSSWSRLISVNGMSEFE